MNVTYTPMKLFGEKKISINKNDVKGVWMD